MYLRRRLRVAQEGQRRTIFLRYLGEVASAVSQINGVDRAKLYEQLLAVAKKRTAEADVKLDDRGRPIQEEEELELGDNCIIVPQIVPGMAEAASDEGTAKPKKRGRRAPAAGDDDADAQPEPAPRERAGKRPGKTARPAAAKKAATKPPAKRR